MKLKFVVSGNHHDGGEFFVLDSKSLLILGYMWLSKRNPLVNWSQNRVENGVTCALNNVYIQSYLLVYFVTTQEDIFSRVPELYHSLAPVFIKKLALSLSPHRLYDCPTNLLQGAPLTMNRLYNLSGPEKGSLRIL